MSEILKYYRNEPNLSGYTHEKVMAFTDDDWECLHDFIQWVFPLKDASMFNDNAPILTDEDIAIFRADPTLQDALRDAFQRFTLFLGNTNTVCGPMNHNLLRITRCLHSLKLFGLDEERTTFFNVLTQIYESGVGISAVTFQYWQEAFTGVKDAPLEELK